MASTWASVKPSIALKSSRFIVPPFGLRPFYVLPGTCPIRPIPLGVSDLAFIVAWIRNKNVTGFLSTMATEFLLNVIFYTCRYYYSLITPFYSLYRYLVDMVDQMSIYNNKTLNFASTERQPNLSTDALG